MLLDWIFAFNNRQKVALYSSDVSGAFDRVSRKRLIQKLNNAGVHFRIIRLISSWLDERRANVIVGGEQPDDIFLSDMVYQGTVLGPILWNLFFGDARRAIQMLKFSESVFADDLHACRNYDVKVPNRSIVATAKKCQERLHEWGRANEVEYEASKESITILSRVAPYGDNFKSLGVLFDPGLFMDDAIHKVYDSAMWKLRTVQRTTRFFTTIEMVNLYKSKVGSYIESKTAAIYHASQILLARIDSVQTNFLRQIGLTELDALCNYRL